MQAGPPIKEITWVLKLLILLLFRRRFDWYIFRLFSSLLRSSVKKKKKKKKKKNLKIFKWKIVFIFKLLIVSRNSLEKVRLFFCCSVDVFDQYVHRPSSGIICSSASFPGFFYRSVKQKKKLSHMELRSPFCFPCLCWFAEVTTN